MATGMLKFSPNNTVCIDLDLENHTANKAVDIDAEGVEWPICGGGGSDFSTATVTVSGGNDYDDLFGMLWDEANNETYSHINAIGSDTIEVEVVLYNGVGYLFTNAAFGEVTGDVEVVEGNSSILNITGDGAVEILPAQ